MINSAKSLKDSIQIGETLRAMSEVFCDLSAARLEQIRTQIEKNRQFAALLAKAFEEVATAVGKQKVPSQTKKPKISVILFSNHGYFVNMETELLRYFQNNGDNNSDLLIVGRAGPEILQNVNFSKNYELLIFNYDLPRPAEIAQVTAKVSQYEGIDVFFPQFKTVVAQTPTVVNIGSEVAARETPKGTLSKKGLSILEPEGPKMLAFFEAQILGLLMEQAFLEAELSRTAARFLSMDSTQQRAMKYIKDRKDDLYQAEASRRQVEILEISLAFLTHKKHRELE